MLLQDTVRPVEKLIELRKENWEVAPYPVEDHSYDREASWADEYKRTLKLFVENLRPEVRRTRRELISLTPCFEGEGGSMLLRAFIVSLVFIAVNQLRLAGLFAFRRAENEFKRIDIAVLPLAILNHFVSLLFGLL